jgi:hypothetical protein
MSNNIYKLVAERDKKIGQLRRKIRDEKQLLKDTKANFERQLNGVVKQIMADVGNRLEAELFFRIMIVNNFDFAGCEYTGPKDKIRNLMNDTRLPLLDMGKKK